MEEGLSRKDEIREENVSAHKPDSKKLSKKEKIQKVYQEGKKHVSPIVVLYFLSNKTGKPSYAIHARKKLGIAVERNRAKRIFREVLRQRRHLLRGYDIILIPRKECKGLTSSRLADHLDRILLTTGLLKKE